MTCEKKLAEIKARLGKATPGSYWPQHFHEYGNDGPTLRGPYCYWLKFTDKVQAEKIPFGEVKDDAELIAHSRTDIEMLVKMVERMGLALDEAQKVIGPLTNNSGFWQNNFIKLWNEIVATRAELDRLAGEVK